MTQVINSAEDEEPSCQSDRISLVEMKSHHENRFEAELSDENENSDEAKQKIADRFAIERGEDDGMIVCQVITTKVDKRK